MTDVPEEAVEAAEPDPAPEPEPAPEEPQEAVEEPLPARWLVLARVTYTDADGNEFFCGPGEVIDDEFASQVDAASIEPYAG